MVGLKSQNPSLIPQWISQNNFNRLYISWYCTVYLPTMLGIFCTILDGQSLTLDMHWIPAAWRLTSWTSRDTKSEYVLGNAPNTLGKGSTREFQLWKSVHCNFFRQSCHQIWTTYRLYVNNQLLPSIDVKTLRPICRVRSLRPPQCGQLGSSRIQSLRDVSGTKQFVVSEP